MIHYRRKADRDQHLGTRLYNKRKGLSLSQAAAAQEIGIGFRTVFSIENSGVRLRDKNYHKVILWLEK